MKQSFPRLLQKQPSSALNEMPYQNPHATQQSNNFSDQKSLNFKQLTNKTRSSSQGSSSRPMRNQNGTRSSQLLTPASDQSQISSNARQFQQMQMQGRNRTNTAATMMHRRATQQSLVADYQKKNTQSSYGRQFEDDCDPYGRRHTTTKTIKQSSAQQDKYTIAFSHASDYPECESQAVADEDSSQKRNFSQQYQDSQCSIYKRKQESALKVTDLGQHQTYHRRMKREVLEGGPMGTEIKVPSGLRKKKTVLTADDKIYLKAVKKKLGELEDSVVEMYQDTLRQSRDMAKRQSQSQSQTRDKSKIDMMGNENKSLLDQISKPGSTEFQTISLKNHNEQKPIEKGKHISILNDEDKVSLKSWEQDQDQETDIPFLPYADDEFKPYGAQHQKRRGTRNQTACSMENPRLRRTLKTAGSFSQIPSNLTTLQSIAEKSQGEETINLIPQESEQLVQNNTDLDQNISQEQSPININIHKNQMQYKPTIIKRNSKLIVNSIGKIGDFKEEIYSNVDSMKRQKLIKEEFSMRKVPIPYDIEEENELESQSSRIQRIVFQDRSEHMHTIQTLQMCEVDPIGSKVNFSLTAKQLLNLKYLIRSVHILLESSIITKQEYQDSKATDDVSKFTNTNTTMSSKVSMPKKKSNAVLKFNPWDFKQQAFYQLFERMSEQFVAGNSDEFYMVYWVVRTHGLFAMEFRDLEQAAKVFKKLKKLCKKYRQPKHQMHIYKQLAYIYKEQKNNQKALKCYKKLLYISWFTSDFKNEMVAYHGLSLQYFYMNEPKKAQHYYDRLLRGKFENPTSVVRQTAHDVMKVYYGLTGNQAAEGEMQDMPENGKKKNAFDRIPSPSAYAKNPISNHHIDLLPHYTEAQDLRAQIVREAEQPPSEPTFTFKELQHLNEKPNFDYLKINQKSNFTKGKNLQAQKDAAKQAQQQSSVSADQDNKANTSDKEFINGVFYQKKVDLEEAMNPQHELHFQKIVSKAVSRVQMGTGQNTVKVLHHHSRCMVVPLDQFNKNQLPGKLAKLLHAMEQRLELDIK